MVALYVLGALGALGLGVSAQSYPNGTTASCADYCWQTTTVTVGSGDVTASTVYQTVTETTTAIETTTVTAGGANATYTTTETATVTVGGGNGTYTTTDT